MVRRRFRRPYCPQDRARALAPAVRTLSILRVRPERFVSETTTATLAIGTRPRDQTDVEHLQRPVVGVTALASAEAFERAGEFDDFDIAFCVAWSDGRGDRCVRIH
jgi:hypothetical protein